MLTKYGEGLPKRFHIEVGMRWLDDRIGRGKSPAACSVS
jgi:hypothetical protein